MKTKGKFIIFNKILQDYFLKCSFFSTLVTFHGNRCKFWQVQGEFKFKDTKSKTLIKRGARRIDAVSHH